MGECALFGGQLASWLVSFENIFCSTDVSSIWWPTVQCSVMTCQCWIAMTDHMYIHTLPLGICLHLFG